MTVAEIVLVVLGSVVTLVTPVVALYVRRGALAIARVADVQLTDEQLKQLDGYVAIAIRYVEELVRKRARGLVAEAPQTPEAKRELAIQVARDLAPDDLATFTDGKIAMVVDAQVGALRASQPASISLRAGSIPPLPTASAVAGVAEEGVTQRLKRPS